MVVEQMTKSVGVDILIATFRRESVVETLRSVAAQKAPPNLSLRIIVADNDETPSARARIAAAARSLALPVTYLHAPARNISIARNACLEAARGRYIAFIDDDEVAGEDWIARLYARALEDGADAVFGPARARYDADAPAWIRMRDYHSNLPARWGRKIETGHTCNALLRWAGTPWRGERFREDKGRSGGEDTEFFFRLREQGALFAIADDAAVFEPVDPRRLSLEWIRTRKFRAGQSYGRHAPPGRFPVGFAAASAAKAAACGVMAVATAWSRTRSRYWYLRGVFHCGVVSAQIGGRESALYGL